MKRLLLLSILPGVVLAIYDQKPFDLNHWHTLFYNDGRWGYDATLGGLADLPVTRSYIFGAGAWVGSIVGTDTLVTFMYNPNTGGTEMGPTSARYWREGYADPQDRIYKHPGDWPPPQSRFPGAPQQSLSEMDLWFCCTDSDPTRQEPLSQPIGVDVFVTVFGFDDPSAWDFFFLKYDVVNFSPGTLSRVYFGPVLDADIGDASDDLTGLILDKTFTVRGDTIRVRNTGFVYDANNIEPPEFYWDSGAPGAVAIMLLRAPQDLGLTAFKRFTIDIDPVTDPDRYLTMAGYDYRTRVPAPYDSTDDAPGDKRVLFSSGPFDLAPDSAVTLWYAVIGSPFGDSAANQYERDTGDLALRCWWAEQYFQGLSVAEEPPTARNVQPLATVVHSVLRLPVSPFTIHTSLFDMTGRQVMALKPGANDVSRLSPGVYFVREAQAQAQAVRKVILTR